MEDKKIKINKKFKIIFYIILLVFTSLYVTSKTGYYEKNISKKTIITKEAIKEFEKDISEGKDVKLKDYINKEPKIYNNKYSNLGLKITKSVDIIFNDGSRYVLKIIKSLFT